MRKFAKKNEVIELLKNGCEIYNHRNESFGSKGQLVYSSLTWEVSNCKDINKPVHFSTINSLIKSKIINSRDNESGTGKYRLR